MRPTIIGWKRHSKLQIRALNTVTDPASAENIFIGVMGFKAGVHDAQQCGPCAWRADGR